MDDICDDSEKLPPPVKLPLLQNAVRGIDDLRIVQTLDEFQATTHGHGTSSSLTYQIYYDLGVLISACVRYDKTKNPAAKLSGVYESCLQPSMMDSYDTFFEDDTELPFNGIDMPSDDFYHNHEIQGLDVVQYAAVVNTNYGTVNLIMNEYAYYGKGHTIHSSGQIELLKNTVDDRSVQVSGQWRFCTIDGYSIPLVCKGGLMCLDIIGKPTDEDLQAIPLLISLILTNGIPLSQTTSTLPRMGSPHGLQVQMIGFSLTIVLMNLVIGPLGLLKT